MFKLLSRHIRQQLLVCFECCACIFPFRTRFYGFSLARPFFYTLPRALEITDDNLVLNLTTAEVTEYKAEASDYLPVGSYAFVASHTFFLTFETKPASTLGAVPLPCLYQVVDPVELLPSLSGQWPALRTMVLAFNVTKEDYDTMVSFGEGAQLTLRREHLVTQGLPELGYTKAFVTYLICQYANMQCLSLIWHFFTNKSML